MYVGLLLIFLCCFSCTNSATSTGPQWGIVSQKLDHFDITNPKTFDMRYLYSTKFFKPGGPLLVFCGGEWEISEGYLITGVMYDLAKNLSGYMCYLEHRYYGNTKPLESLTPENLKYLTSDQALGDVVYFINYIKTNVEGLNNSKVGVIGGSYGGNLALWARMKYPHLIQGAISSSAPLQAIKVFDEYYKSVGRIIKAESEVCYNLITNAYNQIDEALNTDEGRKKLKKIFNTCSDIQVNEPYKSYFYNSISENMANLVQYAAKDEIRFECEDICSRNGTDLEKFGSYISNMYQGYCMADYNDFIQFYSNVGFTSSVYRQWTYQTCTEFGFHQISAPKSYPFYGFDINLYNSICKDLFGIKFDENLLEEGIFRTNLFYGGNFPEVTKCISVYGTADPWISLGSSNNSNPEAPVLIVEGIIPCRSSHCMDLLGISSSDSPQLKEAKIAMRNYMIKWLSEK